MVVKNSILDQVEEILKPSQPVTKSRKILMVGTEVSPYSTVGGLARVIGYLSRALRNKGQDARVFMPKFGTLDEDGYEMEMVMEGLKVPTGNEKKPYLVCNVKKHQLEGYAPVYFLENREYYELRANVYVYKDDHIRWGLLSRGAIEFLRAGSDEGWIPDVIHSNDWHTGLVSNWLKTEYKDEEELRQVANVFTVHNLSYQGNFDHNNVSELNFDDGKSPVADFYSEQFLWQNQLRRGVMYSDIVTTVSQGYAREMLKPEFGEGLDKLLREVRGKLFGVPNGIDYEEFDPKTDQLLEVNFDKHLLDRRIRNKVRLQDEFDLPRDERVPMLSYVGRLDHQKGVDLIVEVLNHLLKDFEVQFVVVGGGNPSTADSLRKLQERFPDKVGAHLMFDYNLPRLVFGGADIILVPSRWEPCGLVQMEAMRYGCVPIVRAVGGLGDTVENFDPEQKTGTGFVFQEFDQWAFFAQVVRAIEVFRQKDLWRDLQRRAMREDNSWENRAEKYLGLYEKTIHLRERDLRPDRQADPSVHAQELYD